MQVYDLASIGGPAAMMPPAVQTYTEKEARFLPPRVIVENSGYVILSSIAMANTDHQTPSSLLDVEDCVSICQRVLGLKIQEIAKLLNISRASLDLHRKGKVKNFSPYLKLAGFVENIERHYTVAIKNTMRSVLIERKTLVQHLIANKDRLEVTLPYFDKASEKLDKVTIKKESITPDLASSRLAGIGKIG